jgi:hypothetical protein
VPCRWWKRWWRWCWWIICSGIWGSVENSHGEIFVDLCVSKGVSVLKPSKNGTCVVLGDISEKLHFSC